MSTLTYEFEGNTFSSNEEQFDQFDNNNSDTRVENNTLIVFIKNDGERIEGNVKDIMTVRPLNGSDNPFQVQFLIESSDGGDIILKFHEIKSYHPSPFKPIPFFK